MNLLEKELKAKELEREEIYEFGKFKGYLIHLISEKMRILYPDYVSPNRDYDLHIQNLKIDDDCMRDMVYGILVNESLIKGLVIHTNDEFITSDKNDLVVEDIDEDLTKGDWGHYDWTIVRFDDSLIADDDSIYIGDTILVGVNTLDSIPLLLCINDIYNNLTESWRK